LTVQHPVAICAHHGKVRRRIKTPGVLVKISKGHQVVSFDELPAEFAIARGEIKAADLADVAVDAFDVFGGSDPTALC
jgi:hypothetical protein